MVRSRMSSRSYLGVLAGLIALVIPAGIHAQVDPMAQNWMDGKVKTGRLIEQHVLVDGSPDEIFDLWATAKGADKFFGSDAKIEPRVGGLYEISFGQRADGQIAGPRQTRILRYMPGKALDFEWEMPVFAAELNTRPLPTWVEIEFESFSDDPERTVVHLTHHGFGQSEAWDRSYEFFQRGWFDIMFRLKLHCTIHRSS